MGTQFQSAQMRPGTKLLHMEKFQQLNHPVDLQFFDLPQSVLKMFTNQLEHLGGFGL